MRNAAPGRAALVALTWLCWFVLLLALLAGVHAGREIARQGYLQQGLWYLAAELLLDSVRRFLGIAATGAIGVALFFFAGDRFARFVGSRSAKVGALLSAAALAGVALLVHAPRSVDSDPFPDILLISVDTLRADHLGAYGYQRPTSPAIDRLAEAGLLFRHAVAQAQWTLPSMASLHTGLYPSEHGAIRADTPLPPRVVTLAEVLRNAGYTTLAVVSHIFVGSRFGFDQGMEAFDQSQVLGHDAVTSEEVTLAAAALARAPRHRPAFLWVHYFDPHFSYVRHPEYGFAGRTYTTHVTFDELVARAAQLKREGAGSDHPYIRDVRGIYDEEIAHTDQWIGRLVEQVQSASPERRLLIFLTADHGEEFLEHGAVGHDRALYQELVRVPLIIAGDIDPALRGRQIVRSVETASLPRTILGLVGIENHFFGGEDLLAPRPEPRPVFSEGSYAWSPEGRRRAMIAGDWKLIHHLDDDSYELYHLGRDPGESRSLWDDPGAEMESLRKVLRAQLAALSGAAPPRVEPVELDPEERRLLRELGYVEEAAGLSDPAPLAPAAPAPD